MAWHKLVPELLLESQFVVFDLRRLEKAADLGAPLHFGRLCFSLLLLLLDDVELLVVPRKLLERNQEVSKVESELVVLSVESKEPLDECRRLNPGILSVSTEHEHNMESLTY